MHHFTVVTIFPEVCRVVTEFGITRRAMERGIFKLDATNPRDYTDNPHGAVDDAPYGGGPGMVMQVAPLRAAIGAARNAGHGVPHVIYLSPQGERLTQAKVAMLAAYRRLILVAGRYEGVDERFIDAEVDEEISIGDYVLSGGELPTMVVIDTVARLIPGVLGKDESLAWESFSKAKIYSPELKRLSEKEKKELTSNLLEYPQYTRPESIKIDGKKHKVPPVLLSGNHKNVFRWRQREAIKRTKIRRPDLFN